MSGVVFSATLDKLGGASAVNLRYPQARMAVFNRLLSRRDCVAAIVECAVEFGLIPAADVPSVIEEVAIGACGSVTVAIRILQQTTGDGEVLAEQLLAAIEKFKQEKKQIHCCGLGLESNTIDCSGMAPIVMDILLQLMEPYRRS